MNLSDAIAAVETASTNLSNADTAQTAAQAKFDAAVAAKSAADSAEANAVTSFNGSLDDLIAAAQAAKVGTGGAAQANPTPADVPAAQ